MRGLEEKRLRNIEVGMNRTRLLNFLKGCIILGVAFFWLMSFSWFQTLVRNLLIGFTVLAVGFVVWFGVKTIRRLKER